MKAVVAAFNQEKALVGAFSVITNLRMPFGWNFLKHYWIPGTRGRGIRNHIPLSAAELSSSAAAAGIFKSLTNSPAFVLKLLNFEFVLVGVGITADCAINHSTIP